MHNMPLKSDVLPTLTAAINRIIPTDDYPNAEDAGVLDYFAFQFSGDLAHLIDYYEIGLAKIEEESRLCYSGRAFTFLSAEEQDALLRCLEVNNALRAQWPINASEFFGRMVKHTAEGFYADPDYNHGNRDQVSWRMIGFANRSGLEDHDI